MTSRGLSVCFREDTSPLECERFSKALPNHRSHHASPLPAVSTATFGCHLQVLGGVAPPYLPASLLTALPLPQGTVITGVCHALPWEPSLHLKFCLHPYFLGQHLSLSDSAQEIPPLGNLGEHFSLLPQNTHLHLP